MKNGAKILTTLFIGATLLAPALALGQQFGITGVERRITDNLAGQYDPAISGNLVVYTDNRGSDMDVWYHDLASGAEAPATLTTGDQELTDVSDGQIVFTDYSTTDVLLYTVATGATDNLTSGSGSISMNPAVGQGLVAWEDRRSGNMDIWARFPGQAEVRVSTTTRDDRSPAVDRGVIAWQSCLSGLCDIYAYDWSSGTTTQVTNTAGDERRPDVSNGRIVYEGRRGGDADIYLFDLASGTERQLVLPGDQINANLSGDFVAFEELNTGVSHLRLWYLPSNDVFDLPGVPTGSSQFLNDIDGVRVVYTDDRFGQLDIFLYEFALTAQPVGEAGADQTVHAGTLVTLNGSGSSDPDGDYPLAFRWTIESSPEGSQATLTGSDSVSPTFLPDLAGEYVVSLVVTDAEGFVSPSDRVTVSTVNTAPTADAGPDQVVLLVGTMVQLDGSRSYDEDGDPIGYSWTMVSRPEGSAAVLSDTTVAAPAFVADVNGSYAFSLRVTDAFGAASAPDQVTVSFNNLRPVAVAGPNQAVLVPATVLLDGSASSDPNNDPLAYRWSLVTLPAGSGAVLGDPSAVRTSFAADLAGEYVVSLVVSDGMLTSVASNMTVTASGGTQSVNDVLRQAVALVGTTEAGDFKNSQMANALTNKIAAAMRLVDEGRYAEALDKLVHDVLPKTDGCMTAGGADKNDWIIDCESQRSVGGQIMEAIRILQGML